MGRFGRVLAGVACLTVTLVTQAWAGGIWFYEQSTPDQGLAAAGRAASAKDASTAYTNPAGMSRLDSTQFLLGAGALVIQSSFDTATGTTESGDGASLNSALPLLSGFFVYNLASDWKLGVDLEHPDGARRRLRRFVGRPLLPREGRADHAQLQPGRLLSRHRLALGRRRASVSSGRRSPTRRPSTTSTPLSATASSSSRAGRWGSAATWACWSSPGAAPGSEWPTARP